LLSLPNAFWLAVALMIFDLLRLLIDILWLAGLLLLLLVDVLVLLWQKLPSFELLLWLSCTLWSLELFALALWTSFICWLADPLWYLYCWNNDFSDCYYPCMPPMRCFKCALAVLFSSVKTALYDVYSMLPSRRGCPLIDAD